jgi:tetratricopeptide (TPR) repeat protein
LDRIASARIAEANILFSRQDFPQARQILEGIEAQLRGSIHAETHARVLGNLGYCAAQVGRLDDAVRYFDLTARILETVDSRTEAVRTRWNVAVLLGKSGRLTQAYQRLQSINVDLESLGMTSEAAVNALEIAELLLAEERYAEVDQICRRAMDSFRQAGVEYTARALTALAYMQEAAQNHRVTPALVQTVREYIRQLPAQPNLLFAPPPF